MLATHMVASHWDKTVLLQTAKKSIIWSYPEVFFTLSDPHDIHSYLLILMNYSGLNILRVAEVVGSVF